MNFVCNVSWLKGKKRKETDFDFFLCSTPLSAISWRPVLVVEEAGIPGENHRPWASNW